MFVKLVTSIAALLATLATQQVRLDVHATAVDSVGCYTPGECTLSLEVGLTSTQRPEYCLEYCQVRTYIK